MPTATLSNGLRVIFEPSASEVLYCGYVVCAGTRHEPEADSGMAHFLEHLSFKGTARRTSTQINNFLERVGGDLNAFTNKQETVYHATVLRKDVARAVDLLTDIVFHSTYPQAEITKEVEVIVDEIDSYRDSPSELIFDEFEHLLFADAPLGRDILGTPERLRQYTTADAHRFADRYYRPDNAIFFVYGQTDFARVLRLLSKAHQAEVTTAPPSTTEVRPGEAAAPPAFQGYAPPTPYLTATSVADISRRAYGYDMPAIIVDGNDVFSVYEAARKLVEHIRAGNGPAFLECKTYRVKGHYVGDPERYRTREEVQKNIEERDPIEAFKKRVLAEKVYTADDLKSMEEKVDGLIAAALKFAQESPEPDASELMTGIYA